MNSPNDGEILGPEEDPNVGPTGEVSNILALISNYTDRPDLFLAEVEKHDPGFTKRMNESARLHSEEFRKERLTFGKVQAYVALAVTVVCAIGILGILALAVWKGLDFWIVLALAVFYAVTQGGPGGFERLIEACSDAVKRFSGRRTPDEQKEQ